MFLYPIYSQYDSANTYETITAESEALARFELETFRLSVDLANHKTTTTQNEFLGCEDNSIYLKFVFEPFCGNKKLVH